MITDVEMQAMEMLMNEFLNKEGFKREHYALGVMNDMLAALDSNWFYSASDKEKTEFVKQFSDAIVGERERVAEENEQTRWICVYKDTLCRHNETENLVYIEVPSLWLNKVLRAEGETDIGAWFDEYTADSTDAIARKALADGVILGCDDDYVMKVISFQNAHPELVASAEKVYEWLDDFNGNIPEGLGFDFDGLWIKDPFYDEGMTNEVDPFVYYGADNMKKYLEQVQSIMPKDFGKSLDAVIRSCEEASKKEVGRDTGCFRNKEER